MTDDEVNPLGSPTSNYGWTKPSVGGDLDIWGDAINADLDGIDTIVHGIDVRPTIGDNRIINGDMRIDQRNNGVGGTAQGYAADRWGFVATQAAKGVWQRNGPNTVVPGFPYYLSFQTTSAYTPLSSDTFLFNQPIEADMISDFQWGTANAQPVTLSFWASSSATGGTCSGAISNYGTSGTSTRSYPFTFVLPATPTWTQVRHHDPRRHCGDMVDEREWRWSLSALRSWQWGELPRRCKCLGRASNAVGATGAINIVATNGLLINITGVKFEIGSVATPFNRQSLFLAKSMADCQRYFQLVSATGRATSASGTLNIGVGVYWQAMRATPTTLLVTGSAIKANASATTLSPYTTTHGHFNFNFVKGVEATLT